MLMILGENSKVNQILGQLRNKIIKQEFEKKNQVLIFFVGNRFSNVFLE